MTGRSPQSLSVCSNSWPASSESTKLQRLVNQRLRTVWAKFGDSDSAISETQQFSPEALCDLWVSFKFKHQRQRESQ